MSPHFLLAPSANLTTAPSIRLDTSSPNISFSSRRIFHQSFPHHSSISHLKLTLGHLDTQTSMEIRRHCLSQEIDCALTLSHSFGQHALSAPITAPEVLSSSKRSIRTPGDS